MTCPVDYKDILHLINAPNVFKLQLPLKFFVITIVCVLLMTIVRIYEDGASKVFAALCNFCFFILNNFLQIAMIL